MPHSVEGLIENTPNLSLGGQQRLPKEVIARVRSEELVGPCGSKAMGERMEDRGTSQRRESTWRPQLFRHAVQLQFRVW